MINEWNAIMAFIISSAVGCVNEPPLYGPLRLLETMERLIGFASGHGVEQDERLLLVKERIAENKHLCMHSEADFARLLEELSMAVTDILTS